MSTPEKLDDYYQESIVSDLKSRVGVILSTLKDGDDISQAIARLRRELLVSELRLEQEKERISSQLFKNFHWLV